MNFNKQVVEIINNYIKEIDLNREPKNLYAPIEYVLSIGGKRVRPQLMLLAYKLYKDNFDEVLPAAAAIEVYHNFTLLHDDLMDNSDVRRNKPTVHKVWDDNTAILSGDAMLILAYHLLAKSPSIYLKEVLDVFNTATLEICDGQQYDIEFETRIDVEAEEYLKMISLKTAVLLANSMKIGAIIAGASTQDVERLYSFGLNIGLAFQLQDDYLDVYGDAKVFGKSTGDDIVSNKKTYMLIQALNLSTGATHDELLKWVTADKFDTVEKIKAVTAIYNELGIDTVCKAKMKEFYNNAMTLLNEIEVADDKKENLRSLAAELMNRQI